MNVRIGEIRQIRIPIRPRDAHRTDEKSTATERVIPTSNPSAIGISNPSASARANGKASRSATSGPVSTGVVVVRVEDGNDETTE
jgi:hypothetical protein